MTHLTRTQFNVLECLEQYSWTKKYEARNRYKSLHNGDKSFNTTLERLYHKGIVRRKLEGVDSYYRRLLPLSDIKIKPTHSRKTKY